MRVSRTTIELALFLVVLTFIGLNRLIYFNNTASAVAKVNGYEWNNEQEKMLANLTYIWDNKQYSVQIPIINREGANRTYIGVRFPIDAPQESRFDNWSSNWMLCVWIGFFVWIISRTAIFTFISPNQSITLDIKNIFKI